jgi:hypothetical protein
MKITLKEKEKSKIPALPVGTYQAVISGLWDVGMQENTYENVTSIKHQLKMRVEVNELIESKDDYNGKRYCLFASINVPDYFGDKATLVKIVNAVLGGKNITKEEFCNLDLTTLIGKNFMASTGLTSGGNAKITGYSPLMKVLTPVEPELTPEMPKWIEDIASNQIREEPLIKVEEDDLPF